MLGGERRSDQKNGSDGGDNGDRDELLQQIVLRHVLHLGSFPTPIAAVGVRADRPRSVHRPSLNVPETPKWGSRSPGRGGSRNEAARDPAAPERPTACGGRAEGRYQEDPA